MKRCFHCSEPIPENCHLYVEINGHQQAMCCLGCQAVAQTIVDKQLESYYQHREGQTATFEALLPEQLKIYDKPEVAADFVLNENEQCQVLLSIEGISCAACAWLIEKQLQTQHGIQQVKVNTGTHRAQISWNNEEIQLSDIISHISKVGYHAYPFQADAQETQFKQQYNSYLKRLGIAGLASMQVMMFAIALYGDLLGDMEKIHHDFLRWVSLLMATPVIIYSAFPFYRNAFVGLKNKVLGMDLPVSIALLGAYLASAYATINSTGEVYFESVSMFTFFLLLGRFLELRVRRQASEYSANLLKLVPILAYKINAQAQVEEVSAKSLQVGDIIQIPAGQTVPADGQIISGSSEVNESLLTGEFLPVNKQQGDKVYAGSVNGQGLLKVKVSTLSSNNLISTIVHLQEQAQNTKPQIGLIADKIARYFISVLLLLASACYLYWMNSKPEDAFWITLSVLVATCPCALSLATPAALTSATTHLSRLGLLVRNGKLIETLATINTIRFDKTGTLTKGQFHLQSCQVHHSAYTKEQVLNLAAQLESVSKHPIAHAFKDFLHEKIALTEINTNSGQGISAQLHCSIKGQQVYKIGSAEFASCKKIQQENNALTIYLSCNEELIASFKLNDPLREDSLSTVSAFLSQQLDCAILSGDASQHGEHIAQQLNLKLFKGCLPKDKLAHIQNLKAEHKHVLMLGDGINDGPVMAAASLSIAMGEGADLAKSSADAILLGSGLSPLLKAFKLAKKCKKIIIQNLAWALGYNLLIVPLAMMGLVSPYIAVIGMSLSSLIVVSNSMRLSK